MKIKNRIQLRIFFRKLNIKNCMVCPSVHYGEKCRERCSGHCINNEHWKFLMVCLLCRTFITTCYNTPDLRTTRAHSTVMIIRFVVYAISTLFMHCRLKRSLHSYPNCPGGHSIWIWIYHTIPYHHHWLGLRLLDRN